jgi:hypothetical protein
MFERPCGSSSSQSIDSQRTEYVVPTSFPSTVSTAVPGGSTPGLAGAAWSDEQPAVTPINSIAAAATQTPFSTAEI